MEKNKQSQEMIHTKATFCCKLHHVFPWRKSAQDNISGGLSFQLKDIMIESQKQPNAKQPSWLSMLKIAEFKSFSK